MFMFKDLIGTLILLLVAVGYYVLANDFNETALDDTVGAGGLPHLYSILLAAIALGLGARALIVWRFMRTDISHPVKQLSGDSQKLFRAAGMLGIGIVYVATVTVFGYLVSLAVAIALVALYQGEPAGWRLVRIAVGGAVAFWIFFDQVLGINMPTGFWPGLGSGWWAR